MEQSGMGFSQPVRKGLHISLKSCPVAPPKHEDAEEHHLPGARKGSASRQILVSTVMLALRTELL